jgi:hypothetical protein
MFGTFLYSGEKKVMHPCKLFLLKKEMFHSGGESNIYCSVAICLPITYIVFHVLKLQLSNLSHSCSCKLFYPIFGINLISWLFISNFQCVVS